MPSLTSCAKGLFGEAQSKRIVQKHAARIVLNVSNDVHHDCFVCVEQGMCTVSWSHFKQKENKLKQNICISY